MFSSCVNLLKNEIAEVEHLRRNLQSILLSALKKEPARHSDDQLHIENQRLKRELEDSVKLNKSLQEQLMFSEKQVSQPSVSISLSEKTKAP